MNFFVLSIRSIWHHRWLLLGSFLAIVCASTVLTGSFVAGDTMRLTLQQQVLMRLGNIKYLLNSGNKFFSDSLGEFLAHKIKQHTATILMLRGSIVKMVDGLPVLHKMGNVRIVGVDSNFWNFANICSCELNDNEIAINKTVADNLELSTGEMVQVRIYLPDIMPGDALLSTTGKQRTMRVSFIVKRIVPDTEMGLFSPETQRKLPRNIFINRRYLQQITGLEAKCNMLAVGGTKGNTDDLQKLDAELRSVLEPEHIGIQFTEYPQHNILQIESERIFLEPHLVDIFMSHQTEEDTRSKPVAVLPYLVNSISLLRDAYSTRTPYSFVVAQSPTTNPSLSLISSQMQDNQILINQWLAELLSARTGDVLELKYYEITPSGHFHEKARKFKLYAIDSMDRFLHEKEFMPRFPGLENADSCEDWDIGMPLIEADLQNEENEKYWREYRYTPKAVVTLKAGQQMWTNRFSGITAVRFPLRSGMIECLKNVFRKSIEPQKLGLFFIPVREQALQGVAEAMDFGMLFVGMSSFLILAALILAVLVFRLSVEYRAKEYGLMLATGFSRLQVCWLVLSESMVITVVASLVGASFSILYTRWLIFGLLFPWQTLAGKEQITFLISIPTLLKSVGIVLGVTVVALGFSVLRLTRYKAKDLLIEDFTVSDSSSLKKKTRTSKIILGSIPVVVLIMIIATVIIKPRDITGIFFITGILILIAGIGYSNAVLRYWNRTKSLISPAVLAIKFAGRRITRSSAVISIVSAGAFTVFAVSSMSVTVGGLKTEERSSGTGGFAFIVKTSLPVIDNLNRAEARKKYLKEIPDTVSFVHIKVREGDDASCISLNRAQTPTLLGIVPDDMKRRDAFVPAGSQDSVWNLLDEELPDGCIPAIVGDSDTATWNLKKRVNKKDGDILTFNDENGKTFKVRLVGKIPTRISILQGTIIISAKQFVQRFPSESGWKMMLVDVPDKQMKKKLGELISASLAHFGAEVVSTEQELIELIAVQKIYLRMFSTLGGLGLLLGTIGLGIILYRNVYERRYELALLRAIGFASRVVYRNIVLEHIILLFIGLGLAYLSAIIALLPLLFISGKVPPIENTLVLFVFIAITGILSVWLALKIIVKSQIVHALVNE